MLRNIVFNSHIVHRDGNRMNGDRLNGIMKAWLVMLLLVQGVCAGAQRFFNLTAEEVRIDSILPHFGCSVPLNDNHEDSVYTVGLLYPEFIDMPKSQVEKYKQLCDTVPPDMPRIAQRIVYSRKRASLDVAFCPVVYRDNHYQLLVSFMLDITAKADENASSKKRGAKRQTSSAARYAEHSVLASGQWAKIRVSSTGVHRLTNEVIRKAGFSDLSKVRVYGYGGNLRKEILDGDDIADHDDLKEISTCVMDGSKLFYAKGPVSWDSEKSTVRTRNPYSDYGYYFITQSEETPMTLDEESFLASFYPSADDYHSLYEVDGYAWYQGGRKLFDPNQISVGESQSYTLVNNTNAAAAQLCVNVSAETRSTVQVAFNDSVVGTINIVLSDSYDKANEASRVYKVSNFKDYNIVTLTAVSGSPVRLDYASIAWDKPFDAPSLASSSVPQAEYVGNISNQDLHADGQYDMVIIVPTSQTWLDQAERLKTLHGEKDGMRVRILPADELYNEFSSGTPDASAYRNYLKMLYDRAATDDDMPKYLLLFGDCVWDNRMLTSDCKSLNADDYLLCFESENSFNQVKCYVDDGYFCMLDDGEGGSPLYRDKLDMSVGRMPVTTEADAKAVVDKTVNYANNTYAGSWQNTLMFMGDDGNNNEHMIAANELADMVIEQYSGYNVKKVLWDAYERESSSTGNTYPDATEAIKQQQKAGALVMNYSGHGRADQISHESVLRLVDFENFSGNNLPVWITASCDIMPFDGTSSTIGETALLNSKGGAVAFFGTSRTVYASYNKIINKNFIKNVLTVNGGMPITIGEAQRLSKNSLASTGQNTDEIVNNLQYSLLGDPALRLALPTYTVVVDSINGIAASTGANVTINAGSKMRIKGHVEGVDDFNGVAAITVRDSRELVTCRLNNRGDDDASSEAYQYYDRTKVIYNGSDSIRNNRFDITFAVPKDINYSDDNGLITVYACNDGKTMLAHGENGSFTVNGSDLADDDGIGPSIYCYLNSPSFSNGGKVNPTPYFVAQITDKDGINVTGNGIGHDLQLIIDGETSKTYVLNDNFSYDFGTYTKGETYYNIPELEEGSHTLLFRAWDTLNNLSTAELSFNVVKGLVPTLYSVSCSDNPASSSTTFIVNHDFVGSDVDVRIELFDMSGRLLWRHEESGANTNSAYTYEWNLTLDNGERLQTGVYLYRVGVAAAGSRQTTKAKKLIVLGNK